MLAVTTAAVTQSAPEVAAVAVRAAPPVVRAAPPLLRASASLVRPSLTLARKYAHASTPLRVRAYKNGALGSCARSYATSPPPRPPVGTSQPSSFSQYPADRHSSSIESAFARVEVEGNQTAAQLHGGRMNTILNICPQQEVWIVERFGKFLESVGGGIHFYIPLVDSIAYRFSMKEQALIIPSRSAITKDNVRIHCMGVLYYKIVDPVAAAYGCGDPVFALSQLAQTSLRSVIGKLTLDETFHERNLVNSRVVETCNDAAKVWGITCLRHEIREIQPPDNVLHAMEMQMEAERRKRVDILQSEGEQQAVINRAEAHKREVILRSEAEKAQTINIAEGLASSTIIQAEAHKQAQQLAAEGSALALERVAIATQASGSNDAVRYDLAQKYISALAEMAKENNTMIVPSNVADISSMLAQATSVIQKVASTSPASVGRNSNPNTSL